MEQLKKKKMITLNLEVEISRKTAVSLFDRFGKDNYVFIKQFEEAQKCNQKFMNEKKRRAVESTLALVEQKIEDKKRDLKILREFNRGDIAQAETIAEKVEELKEDILSDIDLLCKDDDAELEGESGVETENLEHTILQWRISGLPRVPAGQIE